MHRQSQSQDRPEDDLGNPRADGWGAGHTDTSGTGTANFKVRESAFPDLGRPEQHGWGKLRVTANLDSRHGQCYAESSGKKDRNGSTSLGPLSIRRRTACRHSGFARTPRGREWVAPFGTLVFAKIFGSTEPFLLRQTASFTGSISSARPSS